MTCQLSTYQNMLERWIEFEMHFGGGIEKNWSGDVEKLLESKRIAGDLNFKGHCKEQRRFCGKVFFSYSRSVTMKSSSEVWSWIKITKMVKTWLALGTRESGREGDRLPAVFLIFIPGVIRSVYWFYCTHVPCCDIFPSLCFWSSFQ